MAKRTFIMLEEYIQKHTQQILNDQRTHNYSVWHIFVQAFVFQPPIIASASREGDK